MSELLQSAVVCVQAEDRVRVSICHDVAPEHIQRLLASPCLRIYLALSGTFGLFRYPKHAVLRLKRCAFFQNG